MKGLIAALVGGLACLAMASAGSASFNASLKVAIAPVVKLPDKGVVKVPVVLTLRGGDAGTTLESSNPCRVKIWVTTNFRGISVENHGFCTSESDPQELTLASGEVLKETVEIPLDAAKYNRAEDYILRYDFWGVQGTAKFKVEKAL